MWFVDEDGRHGVVAESKVGRGGRCEERTGVKCERWTVTPQPKGNQTTSAKREACRTVAAARHKRSPGRRVVEIGVEPAGNVL